MTKIEWTEKTWNVVTGCTKVSSGCKNCYAEKMTKRLKTMGLPKYQGGFDKIVCHPDVIGEPFFWKNSRKVFINSMSDLFHPDVPTAFIKVVFEVISKTIHTYQILTKRAERIETLGLDFPENLWLGVSVENQDNVGRIEYLRNSSAKVKFISAEPLLGQLPALNLDNIDWVICGGESGAKSRLIKDFWVENLYSQCQDKKVPFFFKQWGGVNKKKSGCRLNNKIVKQWPGHYEKG